MMTPATLLVLRTLGKPDHDAPPYLRFRDLPPEWTRLAGQVCLFCKRGWRDGLVGLFQYNKSHHVCRGCRDLLRRGVMPPVAPGSVVRRMVE